MARGRAFAAGSNRNPAASNPTPSGISQGTMGGKARAASSRPGRARLMVGEEMYLWLLVAIEVGVLAFLRNHFRRHHGG